MVDLMLSSLTSIRPRRVVRIHFNTHTHTKFITPGGQAERATNANLLVHFSSYALISLEPIQRRYPRYTVLLAYYVFTGSRVLVLLAAYLEGDSPGAQRPIFGS
jgi:hypothetical protein